MSKLLALLISFLQIGCFSFGGGYATIPLIQEQVVDLHHWLTLQEFKDIITISQMTPGPLAINTSTFVGLRIAGVLGSFIATLGCILCGALLSIFLYRFFMKYKHSEMIYHILRGLKAASIGFIAASAFTICNLSWISLSIKDIISYISIFMLCLMGIRKYHQHPILIMIFAGFLGLLCY